MAAVLSSKSRATTGREGDEVAAEAGTPRACRRAVSVPVPVSVPMRGSVVAAARRRVVVDGGGAWARGTTEGGRDHDARLERAFLRSVVPL